MRLEISKICTYNNNLKMVFTQVAMLEKEKARLVMGQKTASDEMASLYICVCSTVTGGHLFLMFNMYVNSSTSFLEYVHTSKTFEWYVICII